MKIIGIVSQSDTYYGRGQAKYLVEVHSSELEKISGKENCGSLKPGAEVPVSAIYTRIVNTQQQPAAMDQVAKQLEACATIIRSAIPAIEHLNESAQAAEAVPTGEAAK